MPEARSRSDDRSKRSRKDKDRKEKARDASGNRGAPSSSVDNAELRSLIVNQGNKISAQVSDVAKDVCTVKQDLVDVKQESSN